MNTAERMSRTAELPPGYHFVGALGGDTCTVMVRALHEKSGKGQADLGSNSVHQHPWGSNADCLLPVEGQEKHRVPTSGPVSLR